MNLFILALSLFLQPTPTLAHPANPSITCDYAYMTMPTSSITLEVLPDGHIGDSVLIKMPGGATHRESFTEVEKAEGEMLHGWLSKENPENEIELVIYKETQPKGRSRITNNKMPFEKDIWGNCQF